MTCKILWAAAALTVVVAACDTPSGTATNETPVRAPAAREDIRIVGSSTVYPFSTKVAQEYRNKTGRNVVVESTGSGGGHKLFCSGVGPAFPDITNSSRRQKVSEFNSCAGNGVNGIIEVQVGFDGIAIANTRESKRVDFSLREIFLAFAKDVPLADDNCELQPNPYTKWSEINPALPDETIEAYGPPPTSGTRDAFVEIAMESGARAIACLDALHGRDDDTFTKIAHTLREDGRWIDSGENDNSIVQTLVNTPSAFGVFGYSFLDQNRDRVQGAHVDGVPPTFDAIADGGYPISRSLFFYLKKQHIDTVPGLQDFALEFLSDEAAAEGGYLEAIGLVPLPDNARAEYRAAVTGLIGYQPE